MFMVLAQSMVPSTRCAKTEALEKMQALLASACTTGGHNESNRDRYAELFGPTWRPDSGDTSLIVEVEQRHHGLVECVLVARDTRDGLGLAPGVTAADGALDLVITNVVLMDPVEL